MPARGAAPGSASQLPIPILPQPFPGTVSARFFEWIRGYLATTPAERPALLAQGVQLAEARRVEYRQQIQDDPRRAWENAVPMVVRQQLPPEIVAQLEQRVADSGVIRVYVAGLESKANGEPPVHRYAETKQGETYQAYVYGRRAAEWKATTNASLIGVAVDGQLALSESPLRRLEVGELPDAAKAAVQICPVSGLSTAAEVQPDEPVKESTPVVEAQGQVVYLCDGAHITLYEQLLIQGESSSGGAQSFTGILPSAPTPSVGVVKVLYIPVIFADQAQTPASEAVMQDTMRQVGDFYQTSSYGRLTLVSTVTPPIRISRNQAWYKGKDTTDGFIKEIDGLGLEMTHAKEAARKAGYDWQDYDCTMVRDIGGARAPTSFGSIGAGQVWMRSDNASTAAHEIGHAFGLTHANYWVTNGASVIGPGGNEEYGDIYDNMGGASPPAGHYNVQAKNQIKWLPDEFVPPITASGTYRISAYDTANLENGKRYGLRIRKDQDRTYWGEFRTLVSTVWAQNGLILGWKWPANNGNNASNIQLLDTTPGSINGKNDSPITLGRTFSDTEAGIHITTVAVNATTPPSLDVVVNFGQFPTNQPPTLALSPSTAVVPAGASVSFTATATDPDGDTLSYAWVWPDSVVSPNAATVSRTFSTAGTYTLNCIVSDMKGGTAIRNAVITVSNGGSRYNISGRITDGGVGVPGINVSTSGTNGTLTDTDGYYTISNLIAGTYTVTPAAHGSTFNELFNNSITVGPSYSGANFTVDDLPVVTITAPTPTATENGASGTFRLSRTGSTALPLTVYVFTVQGTATKGSDYNLSPDYVSATPYFTFTIPADQAFLDIGVNTVNDALLEGPETVTLQIGLDASYLIGQPNIATVTILDDDTPNPRVSLTCAPAFITENGGQPAICTVTRTGAAPSSPSLDVTYTVAPTSTATPGTDYLALSGTVTIPAGAASASFNITPINDAISETTETVTLTIATTVAYIADSSASSITVRIIDDDVQVVSLAVTDATAAEVDGSVAPLNPGTFLVTRSGDTSAELTVYYSVSGTALHGIDYEALAGSVVIPAGQTQAPITIMPRVDGIGETTETVILTLAAGYGNYVLGSNYSGTVTIADAGDPPLLEVAATGSPAVEGGASGAFVITAKGTYVGPLTVSYTISGTAINGTDYNTLSGTATINLNNDTATTTISVIPINDALVEGVEDVTLTLVASPNYRIWDATKTATVLLLDDDRPTVFVDPQVSTQVGSTTGNFPNDFVSESATTTTCKFFLSRTGSTTAALTVNYTMIGTATNGTDYTTLSGVATIPAGASGVDISFTPISDTIFEGTETVTLHLAAGSYATGPDATIYIIDDDPGDRSVAFASAGGSGLESITTVNIPVVLSSAAPAPVTVEYSLEGGSRATNILSGTWVRVVRTGTSFSSFTSPDGVTWTQQSTARTVAMSSTSYLAGIAVSSATSTASAAVQIDNVSITGLSAGGAVGTVTGADVTGSTPPGSQVETAGLYQLTGGGSQSITSNTSDGMYFVSFPITNSVNCTLTARVLSLAGPTTSIRAGVMVRETTANNARHFSTLIDANTNTLQVFRATAGSSATATSISPLTYAKPRWLRLSRVGNVFTAFTSADGTTFTPIGGGQTMAMESELLVGLTTSARSDGLLAQAVFDNVSITPAPATPLRGRAVGFVNEPGYDSVSGGTYTLTGSGAGILSSLTTTEDEAYFMAAPLTGDFTLTARLVSLQGGAANAQAGLMVRESASYRARCAWFGLTGSSASATEFRARTSSTTSGEGFGVDYALSPGVLTFAPGEVSKNIVLSVTNDSLAEPPEFVNIVLRNPNAAVLGSPSSYTYTIVDDDASTALPVVGFAGAASAGMENITPALIPVVLSAVSSGTVTANYSISAASTATAGSDYTPVSGTLTFAPGVTLQNIALPVLDDTAVENSETVVFTLTSPLGAVLGTSTVHTFTIQDDDTPVVTIIASDPTATEGGDSGAFTVSRTGATTGALTVNFAVSGTATSGSDYTAFSPATTITIPSGQTSATLLVNTVQNTTAEADETVIVTLAAGTGYTVGTPTSATVTIFDDDVNTVSIVASDPIASEAGNNPGEFTLTRTGPTTSSLTVTLTVTGTATNGTDYANITTSKIFAIGQSTILIPVTVQQDTLTEGNEEVVLSINTSATYLVGAPSYASVTIVDDDLPPTVFISSPQSKSTILTSSNGLLLTATAADDGLPSPLTYTWSKLFGPGSVTFGTANSASTSAAFATPGIYGLRITVNDGQFTATDDIFVQAGGFAYANWISMDQGPPGVRGVGGESNGTFTLIGSGTGYTSTNDSGHMLFRQLLGGTGDCTIIARLTSLSGPSTSSAGLTVRDTSWKGAKRANLLVPITGALQFRSRTTANATDTATTGGSAASLLWLKLDRIGNTITASRATDVAGTPGSWSTVGSASTVTMGANVIVGLVVSAGASTSSTATAIFDNVTVTPAFSGTALHSEDLGNYPSSLPGNSSEAAGVTTINSTGTQDAAGGHFRYQQIWGDCIITARVTSHSGSPRGAQSGVSIRDTTDSGAFAFYGVTTIDGNQVHWRSAPNGTISMLQTGGSTTSWYRLVRRGNTVNAFRADNSGGVPGAWSQVSSNIPVSLTGPLLVGLLVDSNSSTITATGTFTGLSITPLNSAPVISIANTSALPAFTLNATVTDDGQPNPPGAFTVAWSKISGPGSVTFANPAALNTVATLGQSGSYTLRLVADDGDTRAFRDLSFTGYLTPFEQWQAQYFANGDPNAAYSANIDGDGLNNLLEYAFSTSPTMANISPIISDTLTIGPDRFLRLTLPKNPAATDLLYEVQATSTLALPQSWSASGLIIEQNTATTLRVRDNVPLGTTTPPTRFLRVFISKP